MLSYEIVYANGFVVECRTQNALKKELRVCMKTINNMFRRGTAVFKDLDIVEVRKYYNNLLVTTVTNSERAKLGIENENNINF